MILEMFLLESLMVSIQEKVPPMAFSETRSVFTDILLKELEWILGLYDLYLDETIKGLCKILEEKDKLLDNMGGLELNLNSNKYNN